MADSESPSTLFELLYTYFNDGSFDEDNQMKIVYDNACNFTTYGLNRDPQFMKGIDAFTDGFHGTKGHPKCSKGFFARAFFSSPRVSTSWVARLHCTTHSVACTCTYILNMPTLHRRYVHLDGGSHSEAVSGIALTVLMVVCVCSPLSEDRACA